LPVTFEYGKTVGWQFTQGRDFSNEFPTDSMGIIINEAAVKYMNIKHPVGQIMSWKFLQQPIKYYKILGVVKDMVMESPYEPAYPTVFMVKGHVDPNWINIKINPAVSVSNALPKIEAVFKKVIPSAPFEYKFADEEYALKFAAEERIGKLSWVFAFLAIFISCLGLFGLASFIAEQRTKEIGIRKVLGASVRNITFALSRDFVILAIVAIVIAFPVAWWATNKWLQDFSYRTDINWSIYVAAGLVTILLTLY